MKGYIYTITNKINNKKYVGITNNIVKREFDHFNDLKKQQHCSIKLQRAYNKYGKENFVFEWKEVEVENRHELCVLEMQTIMKYDSYNNGYNCTLGGEGNRLVLNYNQACAIAALYRDYDYFAHTVAKYLKCDKSVIYAVKNNLSLYNVQNMDIEFYNKLLELVKKYDYYKKEKGIKRFSKKISRDYIVPALCVIENYDNVIKSVSQYFGTNSKTFYNIRIGKTYKKEKAEFDSLSKLERKEMAEYYYEKWGIEAIKKERLDRQISNGKTPLTEEQIKYIIKNPDNLTYVDLGKKFDRAPSTISDIAKGKSFKELYKKITSGLV